MVKMGSRIREKNRSGNSFACVYSGSREEMLALYEELFPQEYHEEGKVESIRFYQESPGIWCCEVRCSSNTGSSGGTSGSDAPNTVFGKASAQLRGSMLSLDIACHPAYKMRWNHYLVGAPGTSKPDWWENATKSHLTGKDAQNYGWIRSLSEVPQDSRGRWQVLADPTKAGVQSYDVATYSIIITTKFSSASAAGKRVANELNHIGAPAETFGISGGNWKCDDAAVHYDGSAWYATCTWTRSGGDEGWDSELYN